MSIMKVRQVGYCEGDTPDVLSNTSGEGGCMEKEGRERERRERRECESLHRTAD